MAEGTRTSDRGGAPFEQVFPLNSRRLTAVLLRRIAKKLQLPTTAALEELRQMVEGKLADEGEDPMDIQVVVKDTETGTMIELRNDRGYLRRWTRRVLFSEYTYARRERQQQFSTSDAGNNVT